MKLYIENEQSLICSRSNSPQFNNRDDWYYQKANVDEKEIKFYFSYKYQSSAKDIINGRGYYLYFQLESQWYKMDAYQEIHYLGHEYVDVTDYIEQKGTFTTERLNRRLDGVELFDIAQIELISENLECVMKNINKYNPNIEVRIQEGKLVLVNKSQEDYVIRSKGQ